MTVHSSFAYRAMRRLAYTIFSPPADPGCTYDHDHLKVWHKNTEFLQDPHFMQSYHRGMSSGRKIARPKGSDIDIHIEWRVHVGCWAGWHASQLPGDLVECGVNTGMMSLAICNYIDFNTTGKTFYLFDTFRGIPSEQMSKQERARERDHENTDYYEECYELTKRNFAPFPRARLVRGTIPDSLADVTIDHVSYLALDMNIAAPEIAALEHFWPRLVTGAVVLLDDYGWLPYIEQKRAMDRFANEHNLKILTLPTGQGMILKP